MLPPLKTVSAGLRRTTETLAAELARPGGTTPQWSDEEWKLAAAAGAVHGVLPLLGKTCRWRNDRWQAFLADQHAHVASRHVRIACLLAHIDDEARAAGICIVPLKGSALHALGLYTAGERPMADIDLLVCERDVERAVPLLQKLGYAESFAQWKHRVFKPVDVGLSHSLVLGEHRDTPINIELHTRIQERLPISIVDITERIYPSQPRSGLQAYSSNGALMSHLLLHAAGNVCSSTLRLLHLHDISLLAARMTQSDWDVVCGEDTQSAWWALPPLRLAARYYRDAVPASVIANARSGCPAWLRAISCLQTLTQVSSSRLWLQALPGIEWSRSAREASHYLYRRFRPRQESIQERADMIRTQAWLQGQSWVTAPQRRRILKRLAGRVPRMDTLYAVRAAFQSTVSTA
jgi:hypothetical protein